LKAVLFAGAAVLGSAGERLDHRFAFMGLENIMIVNAFLLLEQPKEANISYKITELSFEIGKCDTHRISFRSMTCILEQ
jgi:hypothetical protein